jgi:hypothetical protein
MWNFPFTGEDDDVPAQKQLLLSFFFSVSRLIMRDYYRLPQRNDILAKYRYGDDDSDEEFEEGYGLMIKELEKREELERERILNSCPKILLSLCNDQAARWDIEELAKSQLFAMTNSWPFAVDEFQGYRPARNKSAATFPIAFPVTYEFSFTLQ